MELNTEFLLDKVQKNLGRKDDDESPDNRSVEAKTGGLHTDYDQLAREFEIPDIKTPTDIMK